MNLYIFAVQNKRSTMTDEQIKNLLKEQIKQARKEYNKKIERYVNALKALGENVSVYLPFSEPTEKHDVIGKILLCDRSLTMKQKIIQVLTDTGKPLTSREIMDSINISFPDRIYKFNAFSGNFSQTWQKAGIKKYERPDEPIESRVVYCLDKWFTHLGDLKQEYKDLL